MKKSTRKKAIGLLAAVLLLLSGMTTALARQTIPEQEWQSIRSQYENTGMEEVTETLPEETREHLSDLTGEEGALGILSITPEKIWQKGKELFTAAIRAPLSLLGVLGAVILLSAAMQALKTGFGAKALDQVFGLVSAVLCATVILDPITQAAVRCARTIQDSAAFLNGYIPVFCGIMTAAGQPISAGIYHVLLFAASQLIGQTVSQLMLPLIGIFMALSFAHAAAPSFQLNRLAAAIKKAVGWSLGLMLTVYVGLLGLQSMAAVGADSISVKAAKFVTSSFVPVIGGALSDALLTVQACLKMLKTSVGVYGIFIAIVTFLPVLTEILCWYLSMQAATMLGYLAGTDTLAKLMEGTAEAFGLLLSITLLFGLLFIISTTVMLLIGTGG